MAKCNKYKCYMSEKGKCGPCEKCFLKKEGFEVQCEPTENYLFFNYEDMHDTSSYVASLVRVHEL